MANDIFVYWSDGLGPGHLTIIIGTGANKIARRAGHLTIFQMPGVVCPGGAQQVLIEESKGVTDEPERMKTDESECNQMQENEYR